MKYFIYFIFIIFFHTQLFAQDICEHECAKHKKANFNRNAQVEYFQDFALMNKYDLKYQKLDLNIESNSNQISGSAFLTAKAVANIDTFSIELKSNATVDSVYINGVKNTNFYNNANHIYVKLASTIAANNNFNVIVFYKVSPAINLAVFLGNINGNTYHSTLSESFQARDWYPAKQVLTDKIDSADFWITTSNTNKAGSNGLLKQVVNLPNNKVRYEWKTTYPMSYYQTAYSVGNFEEYKNYAKPIQLPNDSILVQHYVAIGQTATNQTNLNRTANLIESLSNNFGLYPFHREKYGHMYGNIGGGMEHQTMSTMASYGMGLIAHELGHQWWGNNVTCGTWQDIWINEGFASYSEYLARENHPSFFSSSATSYIVSLQNNVMTVANGSVYVPASFAYDENRIFNNRLTYNKGGCIIHTLRGEINNDAVFMNILKTFQTQFKDKTAIGLDFKQVAEQLSGLNLTPFFNQWYFGEGYPTYSVNTITEGDSLIIELSQIASAPSITPFFSGALEFKINNIDGSDSFKRFQTQPVAVQRFKFKYSNTPVSVIIDPNNYIINRVGAIVVGITNINAEKIGFKILQNPSLQSIKMRFMPNEIKEIQLINVSGQIITRKPITASQSYLQIENPTAKGLYFVKAITKNKSQVIQKIIVQ